MFFLSASVLLAGCDKIIPAAEAAAPDPKGKTTRYWDCCKPSGAWSGKASVTNPVTSCAKDGTTTVPASTQSACSGGTSFMASSQQPWAINTTLAYGFAAASIAGGTESTWLCACYKLTFDSSTPVSGKSMIVQVVNTAGADVSTNQFDLLIPGGGVGIYNGCTAQFGAPAKGWGAQYGGISNLTECAQLPAALRPGCNWRFNWFSNANNPAVSFHRLKCPAALTEKTNCVRNDEASQPAN